MERHENTFGFKPFWSLEKGLFISAITDNTPAHQSDLEIGDAIVSINSEDTSGFDKGDFCNMFRQIAGDEDSFDMQKTAMLRGDIFPISRVQRRRLSLFREKLQAR